MTHSLVLLRINHHTKFEVPIGYSLTNAKDMIEAKF